VRVLALSLPTCSSLFLAASKVSQIIDLCQANVACFAGSFCAISDSDPIKNLLLSCCYVLERLFDKEIARITRDKQSV
jgi:hypothetical protein